jgi:hypothetical protein
MFCLPSLIISIREREGHITVCDEFVTHVILLVGGITYVLDFIALGILPLVRCTVRINRLVMVSETVMGD